MSLADVRLPGVVIADMYSVSLVALPHHQPQPTATIISAPAAPLQFLGKNIRHVAVLVHYPEEMFLPEDQLAFLSNVLKACGLNTDDIAVVNTAARQATFAELTTQLHPSAVLQFGARPAVLLPAAAYFGVTDMQGIAVMKAPELETLNRSDAESRLLKSKLWLALKTLFKV